MIWAMKTCVFSICLQIEIGETLETFIWRSSISSALITLLTERRLLVSGFPSLRFGFLPWSGHVGFDDGQSSNGTGSLRILRFSLPILSATLLHTHNLSSSGGTICQIVSDVPSGLSLTPPQKKAPDKYEVDFQITTIYATTVMCRHLLWRLKFALGVIEFSAVSQVCMSFFHKSL
jgi:hypothetical protein